MGASIEEKKESMKKRKDWIKNFAIVFLVILLLLTFFSNTIMNYSLPQVAVQYITPDSITPKVRCSGNVESGDPYNVMVKQTRKVASVKVKNGSIVKMGDVLLVLDDGDSAEVEAAQKALEAAQDAYNALLLTEATNSDVISGKGTSVESFRSQITAAQAAVDRAQKNLDTIETNYRNLSNQITLYGEGNTVVDTTAETNALNAAQQVLANAQANHEAVSAQSEMIASTLRNYQELGADISGNDMHADYEVYYAQWIASLEVVRQAADAVAIAQKGVDDAQAALTKKQTTGIADPTLHDMQKRLVTLGVDKSNAEVELSDAQEKLSKLVGNISGSVSLRNAAEEVNNAREALLKAQSASVGGEVTAPISGTVISVNVTSGKELDPSDAVVVIQPEGQGYFMTATITMEQAKRIGVGDQAELVNSWWYNDVKAEVSSIKPDPSNPTKSKKVTFELSGESLTAGQNLSLSVGQRSSNYDLVVPNSAIHEDNNGKFILVVVSKPSPLGTRYTATRYDVEVIASDDTKSAISGALYGYEYIITTSTKPVSSGDLVRLADN